jgi:hypothetical protein
MTSIAKQNIINWIEASGMFDEHDRNYVISLIEKDMNKDKKSVKENEKLLMKTRKEIEKLYQEAEKESDICQKVPYDAGFYIGKAFAFSDILDLMEKELKDKGENTNVRKKE